MKVGGGGVRTRFWCETTLAVVSGVLLVLTFVWRDWIETGLSVDLDSHSGSIEWGIAGTLMLAAVVFSLLAIFESRKRTLPGSRAIALCVLAEDDQVLRRTF